MEYVLVGIAALFLFAIFHVLCSIRYQLKQIVVEKRSQSYQQFRIANVIQEFVDKQGESEKEEPLVLPPLRSKA